MTIFNDLIQLAFKKYTSPTTFFLQHVDAVESELKLETDLISFRITTGIETSVKPKLLNTKIKGGYWVYTFTTLLDLAEFIRFEDAEEAVAYYKSIDIAEGNLIIEKLFIELGKTA